MAELTPVQPSPSVPKVKKIRRDQSNNNANKQKQQVVDVSAAGGEETKQSDISTQHVDEFV